MAVKGDDIADPFRSIPGFDLETGPRTFVVVSQHPSGESCAPIGRNRHRCRSFGASVAPAVRRVPALWLYALSIVYPAA